MEILGYILVGILITVCVGVFFGLILQIVWSVVPYHVKHKLLGWHYVLYRDSATQFYARVVKTENGNLFMRGGYCREHYDGPIVVEDGKMYLKGSYPTELIPVTF